MENLTPLQQRAQQLRDNNKRAAEEKLKKQQDKIEQESKDLINKFSLSFPALYDLLISSQVQVNADANSVNPIILLTRQETKVVIKFERNSSNINTWALADTSFKSTIPSRDSRIEVNKEDEERLIIAIEEILFATRLTPQG